MRFPKPPLLNAEGTIWSLLLRGPAENSDGLREFLCGPVSVEP